MSDIKVGDRVRIRTEGYARAATVSADQIEAAARAISPDAWNLSDQEYFNEHDDGMHGVTYCLDRRGRKKRASLATARAAFRAAGFEVSE